MSSRTSSRPRTSSRTPPLVPYVQNLCTTYQRWSRGRNARSEDRSSLGQGQECSRPRTQAQVFTKRKKKVFKNFFHAISERGKQKRSSQIFREVSGFFLLNFKNEQTPTMVGTDANAHHSIWGSSNITLEEIIILVYIRKLLAYYISADLNFCIR